MQVRTYRNLVDGVWQEAAGGKTMETFCPCDGELVSRVPDSEREDVDRAVAAARRAFEEENWAFNPRLRSQCLSAWGAAMRANLEELAARLALETGKPINEARFELNSSIGYVEYYAAAARTLYGTSTAVEPGLLSVLAREPVGVVAVITPWNYPVTLLMRDMAPALAAGCTCVLKPAAQTTGCTLAVLELLDQIPAFPKGVVNAVSGRGGTAGQALAEHPGVDMISLTGGLETGQAIMRTAADTMKKVSLELGGKSPNIIFADADLDKALPFALKAIFTNAGQLCTVGSRLVLEEPLADTFLPRLKEEAEKLRPGYCMEEETTLGPVDLPDPDGCHFGVYRGGEVLLPAHHRRIPADRGGAGQGVLPGTHHFPQSADGCQHSPEGDLWAGAGSADVQDQGRSAGHCKRNRLRAGLCRVEPGHRQGHVGGAPPAGWFGLGQLLQ